MKAVLTLKQLIDAGACQDQVDLFRQEFGDSVNVTVAKARRYAGRFDFAWAARCLLDAPARAKYDKAHNAARAALWAKYEKAHDAALAEYGKVRAGARAALWAKYEKALDAAWAEHEKVRAGALAQAWIDMRKRKG